jgi:hypothetical protein
MSRRSLTPSTDPYSPQRRTALVLIGTGTAGAYHAGVLRALHEAGVKLDVIAGRGIGAVGALFAAVDGGQRLWDEKGFWRASAVGGFYPWRGTLRLIGWALVAALGIVAVPLAAMAAGLVVFPIDFLLKLVGLGGTGGLTAWYMRLAADAFAPTALPSWLPRLALLVVGTAAAAGAVSAWRTAGGRRSRGAFWWRAVPAPLTAAPTIDHCWRVVWDLVRGAAQLKAPPAGDLGRRYTELLAENLGQPGFRELIIVAHDVDSGHDLVFALVSEPRRRELIRRAPNDEAEARRAEVVDLAGIGREHLADAVAAALAPPIATDCHVIRFGADSYWRGESHRLCDRPSSLPRILEELDALGVEQTIVVSSAPESPGPHALKEPRLEPRARLGEYLQSSEVAVLRDVREQADRNGVRLFTVRPSHNPTGPFDFAGGFDDRSDRSLPLTELMGRGYEDAYHQFIEPIVGASGERVGQV